MVKMTSAYANKLLRQLAEEKEFWLNHEKESSTYVASNDEEPIIPDYDYLAVSETIREIDSKICKIKHAVNVSNATTAIFCDNAEYTVDTVLIRMAQLKKRKDILDMMRKRQPKARVRGGYLSVRSGSPEYTYLNYDLDQVKREYELISNEIMQLQIALDRHNQTIEFDVDI